MWRYASSSLVNLVECRPKLCEKWGVSVRNVGRVLKWGADRVEFYDQFRQASVVFRVGSWVMNGGGSGLVSVEGSSLLKKWSLRKGQDGKSEKFRKENKVICVSVDYALCCFYYYELAS